MESKPQIVSDFRATLWLHLPAPIYTFIHVYNTVQLYSYRTSLYNCTVLQLNYSDCHQTSLSDNPDDPDPDDDDDTQSIGQTRFKTGLTKIK